MERLIVRNCRTLARPVDYDNGTTVVIFVLLEPVARVPVKNKT